MGNSFAHLPDFNGDQREHGLAIQNFYNLVKPGGILMIDHRNYDYILDHGHAPSKNIYYNVSYRNCQNKVIMKKKLQNLILIQKSFILFVYILEPTHCRHKNFCPIR